MPSQCLAPIATRKTTREDFIHRIWQFDLAFQPQTGRLQDYSRRSFTACGGVPSYRGAAAANILTSTDFQDISFIVDGIAALMAAGSPTKQP